VISKGKRIRIAYDLTVDGRLIQSIHASKPLRYVHGKKQVSKGLEGALKGLRVGDRKAFILNPKEGGYGYEDPKSFIEMPKSRFPKKEHFVGKKIISARDGKFLATVKEVKSDTLVLNFNHPFAGKKLHYDVIIVSIEGENPAIFKRAKA